MIEPNWQSAPHWALYAAMDEDGAWHWFERKPFMHGYGYWDREQGNAVLMRDQLGQTPDWEKSLRKRPVMRCVA